MKLLFRCRKWNTFVRTKAVFVVVARSLSKRIVVVVVVVVVVAIVVAPLVVATTFGRPGWRVVVGDWPKLRRN